MPQPFPGPHERHAIQLFSRVLNTRPNASPFTLILDDLNQRAKPLLHDMVRRALSRKLNVIQVNFEPAEALYGVHNISAFGNASGSDILHKIELAMQGFEESVVIIDSLFALTHYLKVEIGALFQLVAGNQTSTLIGVYHQDLFIQGDVLNPYSPPVLELFKFNATAVLTCKSFAHVLAAKEARQRSLPEPVFGLLDDAEGIVECLQATDLPGIVVAAEFRRKSGRPQSETYFLRAAQKDDFHPSTSGAIIGGLKQEYVITLAMVTAYAGGTSKLAQQPKSDTAGSTFNLALTDKQKLARENVILPYIDAQLGQGGEGGRILYDMGHEDDFDEEEDEI